MLSDLRPDGITTRVVGRLDGFEKLGEEIAATGRGAGRGSGFSGVDLVNRTADRDEARRKLEMIARRTAAPEPNASVTDISRQQRRQAEKLARRAARAQKARVA